MRTTWKFTAFAKVGTRTTLPAITGTPTKSSNMRSGAIVAGAAPTHNGDKRTATACSCSIGVTVTCSCNPALQLLRHVPSIWIMPSNPSSESSARPTATVPPLIFNTSPACAPICCKSAGDSRAIACPMSSTRASATRSVSVLTEDDLEISVMT